jgi:hypothetical protein
MAKIERNTFSIHKIAILENAIFYFLNRVIIIKDEKSDQYRLIVISKDQIIVDRLYDTPRGAKIAFARMFLNRAWSNEVRSSWSHYYRPYNKWLNKTLELPRFIVEEEEPKGKQ